VCREMLIDLLSSCDSRSAKDGFWDPSYVTCGLPVMFYVALLLSYIL